MSDPTDKRHQEQADPGETSGGVASGQEAPDEAGAAEGDSSRQEAPAREEPLPEDTETLKERVRELESKVDELEEAVSSYWDQALRAKAEGENARRRAEKDVEQARKYALEGFLKELLPVKDSLEMALQVEVSGGESAEKLHKGVEMTAGMLEEVLQKQGVEEVNPLEEVFDPNYHQAMTTVETEGEPNRVVSVMQKGYLLNGRLVRPALVEVSVRAGEGQGSARTDGSSEAPGNES